MAAIAMLAVGVGVWTIPREVQFEGDAAPAAMKTAEDVVMAEQMFEDEEEVVVHDGKLAVAELAAEATASLGTLERTDTEAKKESPEPARAMRRSRSSVNEPRAAPNVQAPASLPSADMAAAAAGESRSTEVAAKASAPRNQERDNDSVTAACRRKVNEMERRMGADKTHALTPDEELALGKCYQALDNVPEARRWLRRAAAHPKTKVPAEKALGELASE
jgi:hypothetical protein